jgi:hypothetical protein
MKIFNKCWRKLALIETCQKSICIDGRRRVVPGPCLGDMNVLRWPWGPTILILNHKARTFVVGRLGAVMILMWVPTLCYAEKKREKHRSRLGMPK